MNEHLRKILDKRAREAKEGHMKITWDEYNDLLHIATITRNHSVAGLGYCFSKSAEKHINKRKMEYAGVWLRVVEKL